MTAKKIMPVVLMATAGFVFCLAIWGGLYRIGWTLPVLFPGLPGIHGPLIVCGFLGVMFSLERAVSAKNAWAFVTPSLIGLGAVLLLFSPTGRVPPYFVLAGSLGFFAECALLLSRERNYFNTFYFLGSFLWVAGMVVWMARWPVFYVYLWWMGFVLLVIVGQRLEIAHRIQMVPTPQWIIGLGLGLVFLGMALMAVGHFRWSESVMGIQGDAIYDPRIVSGMRAAGAGIVISALWLMKYDASHLLSHSGGLSMYTSVCLASAYVWLLASGVATIVFAGFVSGVRYDALLHAFFVGFDWFIIFGHAPILAFTLLGVRLKKMTPLYFYLVLLHVTLFVRLGGDVIGHYDVKKWGGALNGLTFLFFFANLGGLVLSHYWRQRYETEIADRG